MELISFERSGGSPGELYTPPIFPSKGGMTIGIRAPCLCTDQFEKSDPTISKNWWAKRARPTKALFGWGEPLVTYKLVFCQILILGNGVGLEIWQFGGCCYRGVQKRGCPIETVPLICKRGAWTSAHPSDWNWTVTWCDNTEFGVLKLITQRWDVLSDIWFL